MEELASACLLAWNIHAAAAPFPRQHLSPWRWAVDMPLCQCLHVCGAANSQRIWPLITHTQSIHLLPPLMRWHVQNLIHAAPAPLYAACKPLWQQCWRSSCNVRKQENVLAYRLLCCIFTYLILCFPLCSLLTLFLLSSLKMGNFAFPWQPQRWKKWIRYSALSMLGLWWLLDWGRL